MRGIFSQIFPNPNAYVNADAKMMSEDAEEALVEIESGDTAGGYYTSTVVVFDEDRKKSRRPPSRSKRRLIMRVSRRASNP
jgi:CagE, TrbE, VirB family, component of type IV transporter system